MEPSTTVVYLQASICRLNYRPMNAIWNPGYGSVTLPPFCVGDRLELQAEVRGYVLQRLLHGAFESHIWECRHAGTMRRGHSREYRGKEVMSMSQADYAHSAGMTLLLDGKVCSDCKLQPSPSPMTLGLRPVTRDETRKHWAQHINWAVWLVLILVIAL